MVEKPKREAKPLVSEYRESPLRVSFSSEAKNLAAVKAWVMTIFGADFPPRCEHIEGDTAVA